MKAVYNIIQPLKSFSNRKTTITNMSATLSLYIPRIPSAVTQAIIKKEFADCIGNVVRVDFTAINQKPGFVENINAPFKSAFVHFDDFNESSAAIILRAESYRFYPSYDGREYWILLSANKPIQQTMMNNSQIVENARFLEAKIAEQAETISKLKDSLEGVKEVVYQLVGGLFNQNKQKNAIANSLVRLTQLEYDENVGQNDKDSWGIWPTTRQGDVNELKITNLEQSVDEIINAINSNAKKGTALDMKVFALEKEIKEINSDSKKQNSSQNHFNCHEDPEEIQDSILQLRKYQMSSLNVVSEDSSNSTTEIIGEDDDNTVSTHSSMPDLVDDSDSDNSMPDLESISSTSSSSTSDYSKRLRNSYELCGNQ